MGLGGRKDVPGPLFLNFIILIFIFQFHLTQGHSCLVDDRKRVAQSVGVHSVVEGCVLFERCFSRACAFRAGFVRVSNTGLTILSRPPHFILIATL